MSLRVSRAVRRKSLHIALGLTAIACSAGRPDPIVYDADSCEFCRMQISDKRFGSALVTVKGRTHKFDSIECMIDFYKQAAGAHDVASVWVSDFRHPGTLINADSARFVNLGPGRTPMGRGLAAVASDEDARALGTEPATAKRWKDLL